MCPICRESAQWPFTLGSLNLGRQAAPHQPVCSQSPACGSQRADPERSAALLQRRRWLQGNSGGTAFVEPPQIVIQTAALSPAAPQAASLRVVGTSAGVSIPNGTVSRVGVVPKSSAPVCHCPHTELINLTGVGASQMAGRRVYIHWTTLRCPRAEPGFPIHTPSS